MTEKLKYKVGDKVLVEAEVIKVDDSSMPYLVRIPDPVVSNKLWVSANNIIQQPPKPKVTQAVMDWYESNKISHWGIRDYIAHTSEDIDRWIDNSLQNGCAFATLIAYGPEAVEVEKEKKYLVKLIATGQYLRRVYGKYEFTSIEADYLNKQELIDAGLEGVFDNPLFGVEEVE